MRRSPKKARLYGNCASRCAAFVFGGTYHIFGNCASRHVSFKFGGAHHISMRFLLLTRRSPTTLYTLHAPFPILRSSYLTCNVPRGALHFCFYASLPTLHSQFHTPFYTRRSPKKARLNGNCVSRCVAFVFGDAYHILGNCTFYSVPFEFGDAYHISMHFYVFCHFSTICCRKTAHDSDIFWRKHIDIYHYIW